MGYGPSGFVANNVAANYLSGSQAADQEHQANQLSRARDQSYQHNELAAQDQSQQKAAQQLYLASQYALQAPAGQTKAFVEQNFPDLVQHAGQKWATVSDEDVRAELQGYAAQFGAKAGIAPPVATAPPRMTAAQRPVAIMGPNGNPQYVSPEDAIGKQPYSRAPAARSAPASDLGFGDPKIQALQASLGAAGFSPPAGFRSKEQQLGFYKGVLTKYNGLTTDDIAHLLASNAIDYKSVGKATQAAASMGGRIEVANNELAGFVPIAKDASAAVDRGSFVPFNRLRQQGQASISDPNLKRMFVATQTVLNAYDVLAARGGTDKDKRAENHRILENADSPEAYNAALDMIVREGQAAGAATRGAMKAGAFGYPTGQPAAPIQQQQPSGQRLSPEQASALPPGTPFVGMDGIARVKH